MGLAVRRLAVALGLVLAAAYVIQADDSAPMTGLLPVPLAVPPALAALSGPTGREYFITHSALSYVPLGLRSLELPILMYHYVRPAPSTRTDPLGYRLSVTPENFQAQMDWLYSNGYHAVNFNDVRAYFAGVAPLPAKPVIITLDDGYRDLYTTAFPILEAHHFTAVAYIVTGFVGRQTNVTAAQVLEMDRAGIEIASHTIDHADLAGRSTFASALYELVTSKRWLEQLLGHPVLDFAYPSGKFDATAIQAVQAAGYYSAVTEFPSVYHSQADRYTWTRVRVSGGESLTDFIANLGPWMPFKTAYAVHLDIEVGVFKRGGPVGIR